MELNERQRATLVAGAILIVAGLGMLGVQIFTEGGFISWVPLIAGIIAMVVAVVLGVPRLSALACVLLGGGGGLLIHQSVDSQSRIAETGAAFFLGLSVGFLLAPIVTWMLDGKALRWPVIPGIIGVLVGTALLLP